MKIEKLLLQHGAAGLLTAAVYKLLTGGDVSYAAALISMYMWIFVQIISIDLYINERRARRGKDGGDHGRIEDRPDQHRAGDAARKAG